MSRRTNTYDAIRAYGKNNLRISTVEIVSLFSLHCGIVPVNDNFLVLIHYRNLFHFISLFRYKSHFEKNIRFSVQLAIESEIEKN